MKRPVDVHLGAVTVTPVRTRADGCWYWRAFWYEHAATRSKALGWFSDARGATKAGAALVAAGLPTRATQQAARELRCTVVTDLLEMWVDALDRRVGTNAGQLAEGTRDQYENRVGHLIGKVGIGSVPLDKVTADVLADYRDRRLQTGAPSTVAQELVALRIAWKWGRDRGLVADRDLPPCAIEIVRVRNDYTPTLAEVERVLHHLDGWPRVACLCLATTGARISEVANMLITDVDLDARVWSLRVGKTGPRRVPLRAEIVDALLGLRALVDRAPPVSPPGWPSAPDYAFGVKPKTLKTNMEDVYLPRACAAANVPAFTPHGLRRHWEDRLAEQGVDIADYAAILGHSALTALQSYRRVRPVNLHRAVALEGLATTSTPVTRGGAR